MNTSIDQLNKLTDEEVRVRVARAMGWRFVNADPSHEWEPKRHDHWKSPKSFKANPWTPPQDMWFDGINDLPNYPADLNTCVEWEQRMALNNTIDRYYAKLRVICADDFWEHHTHWSDDLTHATARQRALAFLAVTEREEG